MKEEALINEDIRFEQVRCIDENGTPKGLISSYEALKLAREAGLDLVCISANAKPPVCKIMNYGKFKYQAEKKQKEARKKQKQIEVKEIKLSTHIAQNDINYKVKHAIEFLNDGKHVKFKVFLRGREMGDPSAGFAVIRKVIALVEDISHMDKEPKVEGRYVNVLMLPNKEQKESKKEEKKSEEAFNSIQLTKGEDNAKDEN
ncbi:translation initiation factor IF-3 [Helicobacter sp. 13S00401-1]|uniref:translation initiation factor IF-3 n=1 Tax=Helicobacter sp. 13S00401-1 TaxID=1905758 RepID=UPI000BA74AC2|nr:translation initiation factor IF-3 [Helicobacter sp. 13S00401-1]PAF50183.1 translation initiation factor IF-3 [Helicobacter sp. 13S00401-1]